MTFPRLFLPDKHQHPLSRLDRMLKGKGYSDARFFIFVDQNSYDNCLPYVVSHVSALQSAEFIELPEGDEAKSLEIVSQVLQSLVDSGADRQSAIVNIGGGAVSDVGGFIAAIYMRGIRYINIPTTLLSMVDAAVGGKTAVNVAGIKNIAGTFYQPEAVCIVPDLLQSLPTDHIKSGSMELLKTMIVGGTINVIPHSIDELVSVDNIVQAVEIKNTIVRQDPNDRGIRKMLNLGHTFAHAIESLGLHTGNSISHGIAVGIGLLCAVYLSERKLGLNKSIADDIRKLVYSIIDCRNYSLTEAYNILGAMHHDKKNSGDTILCVLFQSIGAIVIDVEVSDEEVIDTLLSYHI